MKDIEKFVSWQFTHWNGTTSETVHGRLATRYSRLANEIRDCHIGWDNDRQNDIVQWWVEESPLVARIDTHVLLSPPSVVESKPSTCDLGGTDIGHDVGESERVVPPRQAYPIGGADIKIVIKPAQTRKKGNKAIPPLSFG
jgi:hypothetical protein